MARDPMIPLDFPPLREEAERRAREHFGALRAVAIDDGDMLLCLASGPGWDGAAARLRDLWTDAHASLLADLTRPESRDFWARWLAERVGLTVGATAPRWVRDAPELAGEPDDPRPPQWYLGPDQDNGIAFVEPWSYFAKYGHIIIPGISALTDPASALAAAVLAVGADEQPVRVAVRGEGEG